MNNIVIRLVDNLLGQLTNTKFLLF